MDFLNDSIDLASLPAVDDLRLERIEPAHAWLGLAARWLLAIAVFGLAYAAQRLGLASDSDVPLPMLLSLAACGLVILGVTTWIHRRSIQFALRDHDFALDKGVLWRSQTVQPLCRVQHVEIEQGPVEKRFDIATLKLFSAGTAAASFQVPGLRKANAERMGSAVMAYTQPDAS